jgi:hypothetical protein
MEPTRHMVIGLVTDALVFGTADVVAIDARRGTKEWIKEEALARRPGRAPVIVCNASEYEEGAAQAAAVREDSAAQEILRGCEYQTVLQWESNGLPCATGIVGRRGGVDALNREKRYLADLKSTRSAEPDEASRQAYRMHWHAQIAWNIDGCRASGIPIDRGYLICVESSGPYCTTVLEVTEEDLEIGRKEIRLWMEKLRSCEAVGVWPGYVQSVVPMSRPRWMGEDDDDE